MANNNKIIAWGFLAGFFLSLYFLYKYDERLLWEFFVLFQTFTFSFIIGISLFWGMFHLTGSRWFKSSVFPYKTMYIALLLYVLTLLINLIHGNYKIFCVEKSSSYYNCNFFIVRQLLYFLLLVINTRFLSYWDLMLRKKAGLHTMHATILIAISVFTALFYSFDWLIPRWKGVFHPLLPWLFIHYCLGISINFYILLQRCKNPLKQASVNFHLSKTLFTWSILWVYLTITQYIIINYSHQANEMAYYNYLFQPATALFLFLVNFVIPFLLLLFYRNRESGILLRKIAMITLSGQWIGVAITMKIESVENPIILIFLSISLLFMLFHSYFQWKRPLLSTLMLFFILFSACSNHESSRGYHYFPDMHDHGASKPYSTIDTSLYPYAAKAVALNRSKYPFKKNNTDQQLAKKYNTMPEHLQLNMNHGKELYTRHCGMCHGSIGNGKGHLIVSEKYPYPPSSLLSEKVKAMSNAELYHTISVGFNIMKAHAIQLREKNRWEVVEYVKELQKQTPEN